MTERRKFLRFSTNLSIEYRLCRENEIEGISCIKNLSREGVGFVTPKKLERGTLLNMKLILPGDEHPIYLMGEVAWISEMEDKKDFEYQTGIKFFKIDGLDKVKLLDYVYGEWLKHSKYNNTNIKAG